VNQPQYPSGELDELLPESRCHWRSISSALAPGGAERFHPLQPFGSGGGPAEAFEPFEPKPCFEALKTDLGVSSEQPHTDYQRRYLYWILFVEVVHSISLVMGLGADTRPTPRREARGPGSTPG